MEANVVDLRYKMNKVLKALDRREEVNLLFHGKLKGTIYPNRTSHELKVKESAFYGMLKHDRRPVQDVMESLRGGRHHAL